MSGIENFWSGVEQKQDQESVKPLPEALRPSRSELTPYIPKPDVVTFIYIDTY